MFKNHHAQGVSTAECHVILRRSKKTVSQYLSEEISSVLFPNRQMFTSAVSKIAWPTVHSFCNKERCRSKMPYIISSRSVADGVSLSVSTSKLVCRILTSVHNKVKWICLLTKQIISNSFCPSYTSYSTYMASSAYLRKKSARRMQCIR